MSKNGRYRLIYLNAYLTFGELNGLVGEDVSLCVSSEFSGAQDTKDAKFSAMSAEPELPVCYHTPCSHDHRLALSYHKQVPS